MNRYFSKSPLKFGSASVGDRLETLTKRPNQVDVVRFCSAIRNFHRFHYDQEFTVSKGNHGIIVPGFLLGNWCIETVTRSFWPGAEIAELKFRNTATAPIDEDYEVSGEITSDDADDTNIIRCSLTVTQKTTGTIVTTAIVGVRAQSDTS
uniref:hypothetical protein n=1 Tax=Pararhizobium sp. IMCC3301 TaxID=3067904 RepID=UPI002740601D|nr:hypothetical protein [Pararhizobium sp. IMCC3301]